MLLAAPFVLLLAVLVTYVTVPTHTTGADHFDTLIVLGCPANPDGSVSPEERERVLEAVREFRAGRAEHVIITGSAAHSRWVEAEVMGRLAQAQGIPADALVEERQALNTIQNIYYSQALMQQHGWVSAEVISSPNHLPRTGLILEHWQFPWRTHAARWPVDYPRERAVLEYSRELAATAKVRWFGFGSTPFLPSH